MKTAAFGCCHNSKQPVKGAGLATISGGEPLRRNWRESRASLAESRRIVEMESNRPEPLGDLNNRPGWIADIPEWQCTSSLVDEINGLIKMGYYRGRTGRTLTLR